MVGLSQSAPAVGWGSPLHDWLASLNRIVCARCPNRSYRYGARGMHYLLRQYSPDYYTYNSVLKNTYSRCHKDACVQISIGNIEWLLRYNGVSQTCFSSEKESFHWEGGGGGTRSENRSGCAACRWKLDPKNRGKIGIWSQKRSNSARIGIPPQDLFGVGGWEKVPPKDWVESISSNIAA